MKTFFISFIVILGAFSTIAAQENETITLTLEISSTKYNKGSILLALYDSEESYMKKIYKSAEIFIRDNKAQIVFSALKKGVYAFTFFHDLNKLKYDNSLAESAKVWAIYLAETNKFEFSDDDKGELIYYYKKFKLKLLNN